jgi:hypothetical protein
MEGAAMANAKFKVGQTVSSSALTRAYNRHFPEVLKSHLDWTEVEGKRGTYYTIRQELPDNARYQEMMVACFTVTVETLVCDGYDVAEELGNELREAFDNMPESLQASDLGSRREEAADQCEEVANNRPDIPKHVESLTCLFLPPQKVSSRAQRASEAAEKLQTAALAVQEYIDGLEDDADRLDFEDFVNQLEDDASTLVEVDFPGMYG